MALKTLMLLLLVVVAAGVFWLVWDTFSGGDEPALEPEAARPVERRAPAASTPGSNAPGSNASVRARPTGPRKAVPAVVDTRRPPVRVEADAGEAVERVSIALRLVSRLDRTPIASREVAVNRERFVTDPNGNVSVPRSWRFTIVVPGFVEVTAFVSGGLYPRLRREPLPPIDEPLTIALFPSAGITGVVHNSHGRPAKWLDVRLRTARSTFLRDGWIHHDIQRYRDARTDDFGTFRVGDLPAGEALVATIGTRANARYRIPGQIELQPGEIREVRWVLPAMGTVLGVVQDQFGGAIQDASVWLQGKDATRESTRTGKKGEFRFDWLSLGRYRIEVEPIAGAIDFAPAITTVKLTPDRFEVLKRITVNRGLFISGFVVGPGGEYLPGIAVMSGRSTGDYFGNLGAETETAADGSFRLGPLRPGRHEITADGSDGLADSPLMEVEAGTMGVMLRLPRAARIEGKVIDGSTLEPKYAEVRAYRRSVWAWFTVFSDETDGRFRFEDLEPGVYDLKAVTEDGRVAYRGGVAVSEGGRVENADLRLLPGGKVCACIEEFASRAGDIKRRYKWSVRRGREIFHSEVVTGASTEFPVPAEPVEIRLVKLVGEVLAGRQTVAVRAGERREVRFRP